MKRTLAMVLLAVLFVSACSKDKTISSQDNSLWSQAGQLTRGHEELIELGVNWANYELGEMFYSTRHLDDLGARSQNPIVRGNRGADIPESLLVGNTFGMYCSFFGLNPLKIKDRLRCRRLAFDGEFQDIHFNRLFSEDALGGVTIKSAYETCQGGLRRIRAATFEAQSQWQAGDKSNAEFFLGLGVHTVQDSYAPAHAPRDPKNGWKFTDICYFHKDVTPEQAGGACAHKTDLGAEERDIIWKDRLDAVEERLRSQVPTDFLTFSDEMRESVLDEVFVEEAVQALKLTKTYLVGFAKVADKSKSELEAFLNHFLGRNLNCEDLKRK